MGGRHINHHGCSMTASAEKDGEVAAVRRDDVRVNREDMKHRDEEKPACARKAFYDNSVVSHVNYITMLDIIGKAYLALIVH